MSLFYLTKQEHGVILFLTIVALIGLGINFLDKHYSQIRIIGYLSQDVAKLNLNQADEEELIDVPGIGVKLAQRIIDYRKHKEKFVDIAELKNIQGIGDYKYMVIKDYFTVD
ncbi:ComEA family DNA-binding protein [Candidatus Omnitrophota bacterium]